MSMLIIAILFVNNPMKLKYMSKNLEQKKSEIDKLREGDEICSGVIDSMSEDYLSYISNLVKNAKTPHKNQHRKEPSISSEEDKPSEKGFQLNHPSNHQQHNNKNQSKIRHHSETSEKPICPHPSKDILKKDYIKNRTQILKQSPRAKHRQEIQQYKQQKIAPKIKKRKIQYNNDFFLINEQKTMSISRNTVHNSKQKDKSNQHYEKDFQKKSRLTNKSKDRLYITAQNLQESDDENASIDAQIHRNNRKIKKQTQMQQNFIDNITQYIITLQEKDFLPEQYNKNAKKNKQNGQLKKIHRQKKKIKLVQDNNYYEEHEIHEILKENMKLKKKNKEYEQKVQILEDQISGHLVQCKNRDKSYKNKIADLINHLTYQNEKIKEQKIEIHKFKDLLRTVGQKCKQIEHSNQDESQEYYDKIGDSVIKYLAPTRYNSEIRTKNKKTLQSTMPKYDQQRRFF